MGAGRRFKVATIRGVPIYIGSSWFFIAGLYVYVRYVALSQSGLTGSDQEAVALALFGAVLFFGAVLIHEGAHAVTARALGLPVAGITLLFWGGATETKASDRGPRGEFLVSFAGPASTLVLAGVFWAIAQTISGVAALVVREIAVLNLWLAALNALPGFPLDGGRMLLAATWGLTKNRRTAQRVAGGAGIAIGVAMIVAGVYSFANRTDWWLFLGYIGFILLATGRGTDRRIQLRDQLSLGKVEQVMRPPPEPVPASMSLTDALDRYLRHAGQRVLPVTEAGRVIGTVSLASASRVGSRDPMRPVRDGMVPLSQVPTVSPEDTLDEALEWISSGEGLVLRDGVPVGVIDANDIERWYRRTYDPQASQAATDGVPHRPDL